MANILESQGHYVEALEIYKELGMKEKIQEYKGVNSKLLEYFVRMNKKEDMQKFERWLTKWS